MQSEHPLFRRFENELDRGTHWLEWTTRGADLFARPLGANLEIVWCWPGRYGAALNYDRNQKILEATRREAALRFWPLPDAEHLLLEPTFGFFNSPTSALMMGFHIAPSVFPGDVLTLPGESMTRAIEELNRGDELQFVRSLVAKTLDPWQWLQWTQGSQLQFETLLRSLFVLKKSGSFGYTPWKANEEVDFKRFIKVEEAGVKRKNTARLVQLLVSSFQAKTSPDVWRVSNPNGMPLLSIKPTEEEPTQHERLEALLLWRDFLSDKLPFDEIERLLLIR